jgi:nitrate/nitrite transporter NarK
VLVRVGSPRKLYTAAWLLFLPMAALMMEVDPVWFAVLFVSSAVVTAVNPVAVNAAAPETARSPNDTGPAVGIVAIGRNAGQVIGPVLFAVVLQATGGWEAVGIVLFGGTLLGLVSGWLVRVR